MVLSTSAAYRLWAPYYDRDPNPLLALEERLVRDLLPDVAFRTVIDIGCGTGRSMLRYAARGALTFGVDPSPEMLAEARRKRGLGTKLVRAESSHLPFANEIADIAICSFALSYFSDLFRSLSELARITKRGGQIVMSDLHSAAGTNGWTRSFQAGRDTYEIAHTNYGDEDVYSACHQAGLRILTEREAGFADPERSIFAAAGKEYLYSQVIGIPAVRVIVCAKV